MKKIFVLDTNILLGDPQSLFKFKSHDVVIPISVIEELDGFKKDLSLRGRGARQVSRILDGMRELVGDFRDGVSLAQGFFRDHKKALDLKYQEFGRAEDSSFEQPTGRLFVHIDAEKIPSRLQDSSDHYVLAVALALQQRSGGAKKVVVITQDTNLRIKAQAYGVEAQDYNAAKITEHEDAYCGSRDYVMAPLCFQQLTEHGRVPRPDDLRLYANEFVRGIHGEDAAQVALCRVRDGELELLDDGVSGDVWGVRARNDEQRFALSALMDESIRLVTLTGMAGTGKTLLAMAVGLVKTTEHDDYHKLLVSRPIFPMGKDIGYLPGDMEQKLNPWMQPVFDSLDFLLSGGRVHAKSRLSHSYRELFHQNMVAVEPLTYIRGRSLTHHYFVVDEAQNLTPHEIKAILTRVGEGTKIVLTGDPHQIDLPYIDSLSNGLVYAIERFKHHPIAAHITLTQGERSELAKLSAELL